MLGGGERVSVALPTHLALKNRLGEAIRYLGASVDSLPLARRLVNKLTLHLIDLQERIALFQPPSEPSEAAERLTDLLDPKERSSLSVHDLTKLLLNAPA